MADMWGARSVMLWVFGISIATCFLLMVPRMEIFSPGKAITAAKKGTVSYVSDSLIKVDGISYPVIHKHETVANLDESGLLILPTKDSWQKPAVKEGDLVKKKQMLARGITKIYFQANMWIFAILVFVVGIAWGIGKAGVYRFIPDYFPNQVGVVGGMVGVIGGLGGFFFPIIFGYLLEWTGLWTSSWMLLFIISVICLWWMRTIISRMMRRAAPEFSLRVDHKPQSNSETH
jgi:NNP family nitrate/nitrite transporter-like MFS transporter